MSEEIKNPYVKEIQDKVSIVTDKLYEALQKDDTIDFESFDCKWSYDKFGRVWIDIGRLSTQQFKDTVRKAYDWDAEQRAKEVEEFRTKKCIKTEDVLKIHNQLNAAEKVYIFWDKVLDYFTYDKAITKKIKKWRKEHEYLMYKKPAYLSAPFDYPSGVVLGRWGSFIGIDPANEITISLHVVDVAKSLKEYYHE